MRIYRRESDNFEVQDFLDKGLDWVTETYGAGFVEVAAPIKLEPTYAQLRVSEYPPMADYVDAVVKGDAVQMQSYIYACLAVKAKYPKV